MTPAEGVLGRGFVMRCVVLVALVMLAACGKREVAVVDPPKPEKLAPLDIPLTIDEVMVGPVDFAADGIWRPASLEKLTDQDWALVEQDAISLIASATLITTPGIGADDPTWVQAEDWRAWSKELQTLAADARDAAREKNKYKLDIASDKLIENCAACHKKYRSDTPRGVNRFPYYPKRLEPEPS